MSISVNTESAAGSGPAASSAEGASSAFSAAVDATPSLVVSGNSVDTGRYVITASRDYNAPDGAAHDDGMLKIYDKTNGSYVEAFGDPHLYTSNGTAASFKYDGVALQLADGTQIQIKPTDVVNGVSHIDEVAITKNNQTVVQKGFYSADGKGSVSTGDVTQGGPSSAEGFNDTRDTALRVSSSGDLGTLVTYLGSKLNSHDLNASIDGLGGGFNAFADQGGLDALNSYSSAITEQTAKGGDGPNAAEEPAAQQLSSLLPKVGDDAPVPTGDTDLLRSPTEGGVLPKTATASADASVAPAPIIPTVTDPSTGISRDTIDAMLAAANGVGPEVGYATYTPPGTTQQTADTATATG
jgi:hypothetical protein